MFLPDQHTHSLCSPDGSEPLTALAQAAIKAGLSELYLTDHCDLLTAQGKQDRSFSWDGVENQLRLARAELDGRLPLRMGLELGEAWEDPAYAQSLVDHPGLDFVLGSVHNLSSADGGLDFYFLHYTQESDCYFVLDRYFDCMERLTEIGCYDCLAHIIYPLRYMNDRDGCHARLDRYIQRLKRILSTVVSTGKAIEVNTCRGQTVEPWREVLRLYKDCGGSLVTLGSDAHRSQDVGKGLAQAAALLKEEGFRQVARYVHRTPILTDL